VKRHQLNAVILTLKTEVAALRALAPGSRELGRKTRELEALVLERMSRDKRRGKLAPKKEAA
jgi:hypothetical protein